MSNKQNQTNVKVCNHKPGDTWEDGCCGNEQVKHESSETISNNVQNNQIPNERDNTSVNPQK